MLKRLIITFTVILLSLPGKTAQSQTFINGKVLSVDGRTIPASVISVDRINKQDVFNEYENVTVGKDGSYELQIQKPGLYQLIFRGVFHQDLRIPILIYDQPSMDINILMIPKRYNPGHYFDQKEFLEWIRVVGNFNGYDFITGKKFTLNSDSSISAFIPVQADTIRYFVRGLTYPQGSAVLPVADEFNFIDNLGFESVIYTDLPKDSLELRYEPGKTIPYINNDPVGINPMTINIDGFISVRNNDEENWICPLGFHQLYRKQFRFLDWQMSNGLPIEFYKKLQIKYAGDIFNTNHKEDLIHIEEILENGNLHPQQRAILTMSYVNLLGWMEKRTIYHEMNMVPEIEVNISEINPNEEIIHSLTEVVSPVHPAWIFRNSIVDYLLAKTDHSEKVVNYFYKLIRNHADEGAVRNVAISVIRNSGSEYSSVEEMPVYNLILARFGENDLARDAQMAFRNPITK